MPVLSLPFSPETEITQRYSYITDAPYCASSVSLDAHVLAGLGEFPVESNKMAMKRMGNQGNTMASSSMDVGQMPKWFTQAKNCSLSIVLTAMNQNLEKS